MAIKNPRLQKLIDESGKFKALPAHKQLEILAKTALLSYQEQEKMSIFFGEQNRLETNAEGGKMESKQVLKQMLEQVAALSQKIGRLIAYDGEYDDRAKDDNEIAGLLEELKRAA